MEINPEAALLMMFFAVVGAVGLTVWTRIRYIAMERRFWAVVARAGLPPSVVRTGISSLEEKQVLPQRDQRLDQMEGRLDQLTDQLERLAESQDFISRIMVERLDQPSDSAMRTPH